jgi:hypothetical protein
LRTYLPCQFFQQRPVSPRHRTYEALQSLPIQIVAVGNRLSVLSFQVGQQARNIGMSMFFLLMPFQAVYERLGKLFQSFEHTVKDLWLYLGFLKNPVFLYFKTSFHDFSFPWGFSPEKVIV